MGPLEITFIGVSYLFVFVVGYMLSMWAEKKD